MRSWWVAASISRRSISRGRRAVPPGSGTSSATVSAERPDRAPSRWPGRQADRVHGPAGSMPGRRRGPVSRPARRRCRTGGPWRGRSLDYTSQGQFRGRQPTWLSRGGHPQGKHSMAGPLRWRDGCGSRRRVRAPHCIRAGGQPLDQQSQVVEQTRCLTDGQEGLRDTARAIAGGTSPSSSAGQINGGDGFVRPDVPMPAQQPALGRPARAARGNPPTGALSGPQVRAGAC